jgi:hypothetical protein
MFFGGRQPACAGENRLVVCDCQTVKEKAIRSGFQADRVGRFSLGS